MFKLVEKVLGFDAAEKNRGNLERIHRFAKICSYLGIVALLITAALSLPGHGGYNQITKIMTRESWLNISMLLIAIQHGVNANLMLMSSTKDRNTQATEPTIG